MGMRVQAGLGRPLWVGPIQQQEGGTGEIVPSDSWGFASFEFPTCAIKGHSLGLSYQSVLIRSKREKGGGVQKKSEVKCENMESDSVLHNPNKSYTYIPVNVTWKMKFKRNMIYKIIKMHQTPGEKCNKRLKDLHSVKTAKHYGRKFLKNLTNRRICYINECYDSLLLRCEFSPN